MTSLLKLAAFSALAMLLSACATSAAPRFQQGDFVLAHWDENDIWVYPAVVNGPNGDNYYVSYFDGDSGDTGQRGLDVRPFDWDVGRVLECRDAGGQWYPARLSQMNADHYAIRAAFDNINKGDTEIALCRSH